MSCKGHQLLHPPIFILKCDICCPRIGSLVLSMICFMSNLNFHYLEPGIMIIHWNQDVIMQYELSLKEQLKESRKEGKSKLAKTFTTKTWYLGRIYRMHRKISNRWMKYRQPIDLLDRPSNMGEKKTMLASKKNGLMWTYDFKDHISWQSQTIIAVATMAYIGEPFLYELHPTDE